MLKFEQRQQNRAEVILAFPTHLSTKVGQSSVEVIGRGYVGSLIARMTNAANLTSLTGTPASVSDPRIAIIASGPSSVDTSVIDLEEWKSKLTTWVRKFGHRYEHIIYISSAGTVYGEARLNAAIETDQLKPVSDYGEYHKTVEQHLLDASRFDATIVRLTNIYGPSQLTKKKQGFISAVVRAAKSQAPLTIFGDGENVRDYIHENDVIDALKLILKKPEPGIFNLSSGYRYSLNDIISSVEQLWGRRLSVRRRPSRFCDLTNVNVSNEKLKRLYGWTPRYSLKSGIESYRQVI